jgi:7-carboxy-7-deazaguanine synthase
MKINEIFYSIQGEGRWTGLPNIFIRSTGCNLRCSFCDTKYAYENGVEMTINKIMLEIRKYPCKYVCITGGEPLLQTDILDLIDNLIKKDYKISIETNGSIDIKKITRIASLMISMDVKCPSSNMHEKTCFENIAQLKSKDQIKMIIKEKNDYEYAKKLLVKYKPKSPVFLQSVWGTDINNLAEWILNDGLDVNLGIQLHKIIWGDKKGR